MKILKMNFKKNYMNIPYIEFGNWRIKIEMQGTGSLLVYYIDTLQYYIYLNYKGHPKEYNENYAATNLETHYFLHVRDYVMKHFSYRSSGNYFIDQKKILNTIDSIKA